jgi:hypothetical protein
MVKSNTNSPGPSGNSGRRQRPDPWPLTLSPVPLHDRDNEPITPRSHDRPDDRQEHVSVRPRQLDTGLDAVMPLGSVSPRIRTAFDVMGSAVRRPIIERLADHRFCGERTMARRGRRRSVTGHLLQERTGPAGRGAGATGARRCDGSSGVGRRNRTASASRRRRRVRSRQPQRGTGSDHLKMQRVPRQSRRVHLRESPDWASQPIPGLSRFLSCVPVAPSRPSSRPGSARAARPAR